MQMFSKYLAEFIGTFAIVFAGCGAIASDHLAGGAISHVGVALSFGLVVMTMVYATGHLSGAHLNPAVTLGFCVARHFPIKQVLPYVVAQSLGAIAASLFLKLSLANVATMKGVVLNAAALGVTQPIDGFFITAFCWELTLTFFLMFVIMAVATDYRAVGILAGVAIGATVGFEAMFAGPISGASMNPARSLGPALVAGDFTLFSAYVLGPCAGAVLGALAYRFVRCDREQDAIEVKGCC